MAAWDDMFDICDVQNRESNPTDTRLLEERNAHTDEHPSPILQLELMYAVQFAMVIDLKHDYSLVAPRSAINNDNEFSNR